MYACLTDHLYVMQKIRQQHLDADWGLSISASLNLLFIVRHVYLHLG